MVDYIGLSGITGWLTTGSVSGGPAIRRLPISSQARAGLGSLWAWFDVALIQQHRQPSTTGHLDDQQFGVVGRARDEFLLLKRCQRLGD